MRDRKVENFPPEYDGRYLSPFIALSRCVGNIKAAQLELLDVLEDDRGSGLGESPVDGLVIVAAQTDHQSAAVRDLQHLALRPVRLVLAATRTIIRTLLK